MQTGGIKMQDRDRGPGCRPPPVGSAGLQARHWFRMVAPCELRRDEPSGGRGPRIVLAANHAAALAAVPRGLPVPVTEHTPPTPCPPVSFDSSLVAEFQDNLRGAG